MKREASILLAGGIGLFTVIGIIGLRKFLSQKAKKYNEYYKDYHRHFDRKNAEEDHHGVEYFALK